MNKEKLEKYLSKRESRDSLVNRGILLSGKMDSLVSQKISNLHRNQKYYIMDEKLRCRPNINELIQKKIIIQNPTVNFSNQNSFNNNLDSHYLYQNNNYTMNENFIPQYHCSNNEESNVKMDPFQKQQIQYILSDHLVNRPGPIDLLNDQILCPDLQFASYLNTNEDKNVFVNENKKTKKYNFHEVTPDQIKSKNSMIKNKINNEQKINENSCQKHYKNLIEQQTIYLNYEVARRNALICRLYKKQDNIVNYSQIINKNNLNHNNKCQLNSNSQNNYVSEELKIDQCPTYQYPSNVNSFFSQNFNFNSNSNVLDSDTTVDDYLRKFDINIPSFRKSSDCSFNGNKMGNSNDLFYQKNFSTSSQYSFSNMNHLQNYQATQNGDYLHHRNSFTQQTNMNALNMNSSNTNALNMNSSNINALNMNSLNMNALNMNSSNINALNMNSSNMNPSNMNALNMNSSNTNALNMNSSNMNSSNINASNINTSFDTCSNTMNSSDVYSNGVSNYYPNNYNNISDYSKRNDEFHLDINNLVSFYELLTDISRNSRL